MDHEQVRGGYHGQKAVCGLAPQQVSHGHKVISFVDLRQVSVTLHGHTLLHQQGQTVYDFETDLYADSASHAAVWQDFYLAGHSGLDGAWNESDQAAAVLDK